MAPTLGKAIDGGAEVVIDLERLIESRLLLQANSGGGKSWAVRRLLEQTQGAVLQLVIDVEDEFHTLRERGDYVLAGRHGGDCPADVKTASVLARRLLELGASAILGIYELKPPDRIRFVRLFLEAVINAPRALWRPTLIVIDEAHLFCPQQGQAESASALVDLMTRGRKRGFCGVLATQRISKLHKDAAAECNNKLIGRSALDVDMRRAADELGLASKDDQRRLRTLAPGHFYGFGPAISPTVIELEVGPVETTHPKAGQRAAPPPPARGAVQQVLAQLADLPREADEEARSAEELRAQVKELQRELRAAKKGASKPAPAAKPAAPRLVTPITPQMAEQIVRDAAQLQDLIARHEEIVSATKKAALSIGRAGRDASKALDRIKAGRMPFGGETFEVEKVAAAEAEPEAEKSGRRLRTEAVADRLLATATTAPSRHHRPEPRQRLLDTLALLEAIQVPAADRTQLAFMADQSPKSSQYGRHLKALLDEGLVCYPKAGQVALTARGRAGAVAPEAPPTNEELHALLASRLPGPRWRILAELIAVYPDAVERTELARRVDQSPKSSQYGRHLTALVSLGLVMYPRPGEVAGRDRLFLEGA